MKHDNEVQIVPSAKTTEEAFNKLILFVFMG